MNHASSNARKGVIWMLVVGIFAVLVVFWVPTLTDTIRAFSGAIGKEATDSRSQFSQEWSEAQKEIKVLADAVATATNSTGPISKEQIEAFAKEIDARAAISAPAEFPVHEDSADAIIRDSDPTQASCTRSGGLYVERTKEDHEYGVCIFRDGSECEIEAFANNECRQGQYRRAEDGITIIPDLVLEVQKAGHCTARTSPIAWTDDENADYICLEGVTIKNIGWGDAKASAIRTAGKYYEVPAIKAGESFTFSDHFPFIKAKVNNQAVIVVDAKSAVAESNEDNNVYTFPK